MHQERVDTIRTK